MSARLALNSQLYLIIPHAKLQFILSPFFQATHVPSAGLTGQVNELENLLLQLFFSCLLIWTPNAPGFLFQVLNILSLFASASIFLPTTSFGSVLTPSEFKHVSLPSSQIVSFSYIFWGNPAFFGIPIIVYNQTLRNDKSISFFAFLLDLYSNGFKVPCLTSHYYILERWCGFLYLIDTQ